MKADPDDGLQQIRIPTTIRFFVDKTKNPTVTESALTVRCSSGIVIIPHLGIFVHPRRQYGIGSPWI